MQNKVSVNTNIGMLRDRSVSKVDNQFAFENHNIRITARDKDTLLSVTNERGNKKVTFSTSEKAHSPFDNGIFCETIEGEFLGKAVLNNYLVVFTKSQDADRIYRIEYVNEYDEWCLRLLYQGDLNFNMKYPIETVSLFETENVQKVYWVDGLNQPRVINIKKNYFSGDEFSKSTIFDFVTDYNHSGDREIQVSVEKQQLSIGSFPACTVQYLCTYFNQYGQETNPVYISPLYYASPDDRGGNPEETYTCSFKISVSNFDTDFDYIRVYAVLRTSESGTPISYIVGTLSTSNSNNYVIDSGQGDNIPIDPTVLLYIGGREIVAGTLSHKDNTLFLGDLHFKASEKDQNIQMAIESSGMYDPETFLTSGKIVFSKTTSQSGLDVPYYTQDGLYPYKSQLNYSSDKITGFKGGEKYRFAVQFITKTGQRSRAFFIGDAENTLYPEIDNGVIHRVLPQVTIPYSVISVAKDAGYEQVILLMAQASDGDRAIVAQGIVNPTVFNLNQRGVNAPYAISSWFSRPRNCRINSRHFESVNNVNSVVRDENGKITKANVSFCEVQNIEPDITPFYTASSFKDTLIGIAFSFRSECVESGRVTSTNLFGRMDYDHLLGVIYKFQDSGGNILWKRESDISSETISDIPEDSVSFDDNDWGEVLGNTKGGKSGEFSHRSDRIAEVLKWFEAAGIPKEYYTGIADTYIIHQDTTNRVKFYNQYVPVSIGDATTQNYFTRLHGEQYFIDENVVTLNTPDIDILQMANWSNLKFRIIGIAETTSNITDYTIQTTTGLLSSSAIYKTEFSATNPDSPEGLVSFPLLYDGSYTFEDGKYTSAIAGDAYYNIFPFQKEGSITHNEKLTAVYGDGDESSRIVSNDYSRIEKKIIANLKYCYDTKYLWTGSSAWKPIDNSTMSTLPAMAVTSGSQSNQYKQLKQGDTSYIYQGTYDYMSSSVNEFGIYTFNGSNGLDIDTVRGSMSNYLIGSKEPVRIQYQSLPHAVIKFGRHQSWGDEILPVLTNENATDIPQGATVPWGGPTSMYQRQLLYTPEHPYFFIGELYKDFSGNDDRYGGHTKSDVENNIFIPISDRYSIGNGEVSIQGTQGDTYFQRWDCLKTEPFSDESHNGIVDITSFMVETHTNIDGRYDARRGLLKNVTTDRENSNLINRVYSNTNNFFAANVLPDKYFLSDFPNQITWTKTKTLAEDVDTWTNITVASTLDLDGDKGKVRAIRRFNNALIAFQDRGISEILFNSRTQLTTTQGVPVEIANSGKVDGKRYISEKAGCVNKWSIIETKSGLYFIDNINKNISLIASGFSNISDGRGFSAWVKSFNSLDVWNPEDYGNFVTFYDSIHNDVYFLCGNKGFTTDQNCLVFNETLSQFTSFYDYSKVPLMVNVGDRFISLFKTDDNLALWLQNEGDYNNIYGQSKPYWIRYRISPDPYGDKTFNNIEYRADIIKPSDDTDVVEQINNLTNKTFDTLRVWNEYQEGEIQLQYNKFEVSNLKRKFRIWRADMPRDSKDPFHLNRIRNPWIYLQLSKTVDLANERMEFHDLLVKYYE